MNTDKLNPTTAKDQNDLGITYHKNKDFKKAVYWITKAAEQDFVDAQYNLAILYLKGEGVEQNYRKASSLFSKGARKGHAKSQYNLSVIYAKGVAGIQDNLAATVWLKRAAANGHIRSKEILDKSKIKY